MLASDRRHCVCCVVVRVLMQKWEGNEIQTAPKQVILCIKRECDVRNVVSDGRTKINPAGVWGHCKPPAGSRGEAPGSC